MSQIILSREDKIYRISKYESQGFKGKLFVYDAGQKFGIRVPLQISLFTFLNWIALHNNQPTSFQHLKKNIKNCALSGKHYPYIES